MKLTKNLISREQALAISKDYVEFVEGNHNLWEKIVEPFNELKHGHKVITYWNGQFVYASVTKVDRNCIEAEDGPVVRVSNGEYSWRVDGDRYAYRVK